MNFDIPSLYEYIPPLEELDTIDIKINRKKMIMFIIFIIVFVFIILITYNILQISQINKKLDLLLMSISI